VSESIPDDARLGLSLSVLGQATVSAIRQNRNLVVAITVAAALGSIGTALLISPWYDASASFLPDNPSSTLRSAALLGVASQLGLQTSVAESPQFYAYLVKSRTILEGIGKSHFVNRNGQTQDLASYYGFDGLDSARRLESTIRNLNHNVRSDLDVRTGVISFSVRASDPALSRAIADSFLAQINNFLQHVRSSRASNERLFLERRVAEAQQDLRAQEETLRQFYEHNRQIANSPALQFEEVNLRRRVDLGLSVYTQLQSDLERARLNEVRDTPTLTIVEAPATPVRKAGPPRTLIALAGSVTGFLIALAFSISRTAFVPGKGASDAGQTSDSSMQEP
jgi:uncharacterized protein involved in exopolysaccharide biosynthesis